MAGWTHELVEFRGEIRMGGQVFPVRATEDFVVGRRSSPHNL